MVPQTWPSPALSTGSLATVGGSSTCERVEAPAKRPARHYRRRRCGESRAGSSPRSAHPAARGRWSGSRPRRGCAPSSCAIPESSPSASGSGDPRRGAFALEELPAHDADAHDLGPSVSVSLRGVMGRRAIRGEGSRIPWTPQVALRLGSCNAGRGTTGFLRPSRTVARFSPAGLDPPLRSPRPLLSCPPGQIGQVEGQRGSASVSVALV